MQGFVQGADRQQTTLLPECLDDWVDEGNSIRAVDVFVDALELRDLGFDGVDPAATGRPAYHPSPMLKLYIYGYLNRVQSSRRLEREAGRNLEVMWLTGRLAPDHKTIADFRKDNGRAIRQVCARFVVLCRMMGLLAHASVAIDGSKFRAVSSAAVVREREAVKCYLDQLESADEQDEVVIDPSAVAAALEKLQQDPEPEARLMLMAHGTPAPAYNVQTAVDAEHGMIVAQQVTTEATDNRSLLPMAEAAKQALGAPETLNVVADAGYSNGEQAAQCEAQGILPHVPANRGINNKGDGTLFDRTLFLYDEKTDTFRCPADKTLSRKQVLQHKRTVQYAASVADCSQCPLKTQCTTAERRFPADGRVHRCVGPRVPEPNLERSVPAAAS